MEVSLTTKNRLPYNPETLLLGILCGENHNLKRYMHPGHCSTIHNSHNTEATEMSINRWKDRQDVVHVYSGILLSHKNEWNNEIMPFTTQMDPEIIILNEVN